MSLIWTPTDLVDTQSLTPEGEAQVAVLLDGLAKGVVSHYEAVEMIDCSGLPGAAAIVGHRIDVAA